MLWSVLLVSGSYASRAFSSSQYIIEDLSNLKFKTLQNANLSEIGITTSIIDDNAGYMWLVGDRGVARYDGMSAKIFKNEPGVKNSLPPRLIKGMVKGLDGELWLYTENGLYFYNPEKEVFSFVPLDLAFSNAPAIGRVAVSKTGELWLGFLGNGFALYDPKSGLIKQFLAPMNAINNAVSHLVREIIEDSSGNVWLGTDKGLSRFEIATSKYTHFHLDEFKNTEVTALYQDKQGYIWAGTEVGVYRVKPDGLKVDKHKALSKGRIGRIQEDNFGRLWLSMTGSGLVLYDPKSDTFKQVESDASDPQSLQNKVLLMFSFNSKNELWVGYYPSGGAVLDLHASAIKTYKSNPGKSHSLVHSTVNAITLGNSHDLWVATDGGVARLDLYTNQFTHFNHDPNDENSLSSDSAHSIMLDSMNRLWVGTWMGGLSQYNINTEQYTRYLEDDSQKSSIDDNVVWALAERDENTILVGTRKGLSILDVNSGRFDRVQNKNEEVRGLHKISEEHILVQNLNSVSVLDKVSLLPVDIRVDGWSTLAPVSDTYVNEAGEVWFATSKGIKYWKNLKAPVVDFYKTGESAHTGYFQIVEDKKGGVWLGSDFGVTLFDRKESTYTSFTVDHGLLGNSFTHANDTALLPDGRVVMGSTKGLAMFNPNTVYIEKVPSKTVLTEFTVLDKPVNYTEVGAPIDKAISMAKQIALQHHQRVFSLSFTSLDYQLSQRTSFYYRLKGFDEDWRDSGGSRKATYTNLDPGSYIFTVKARNDRGLWSESNAEIEVIVHPPWWLTWWAYVIYGAVLCSLLSLIFYVFWSKQQRSRELKVNEKLKEVDALKDEFLANTSHELRTPLHGIISLSELVLDDGDELNSHKKESLQLIRSSAKRLSSLINDILDFSKLKQASINLSIEPVELHLLVNEVLGLIRPLVKDKNLDLINDVPIDTPQVNADLNRLQQIFHNLIGNAIKFTQSGTVRISAEVESDWVVISVVDTGIGIPQDRISSIFYHFEQVDGSIERDFGGTGLGLAVTKQLVNLHGGDVKVESELGKGTKFYFNIPISSAVHTSELKEELSKPHIVSNVSELDLRSNQNESTYQIDFLESYAKNCASESTHILVVDDEMVNRRVLEEFLHNQNCVTSSCRSGSEVLRLFDSENSLDKVSLILLDVMMPGMSGLEVCERVRSRYSANQLPIIFLTAKSGVEDIERGYSAGGNDYLKKPFSKTELLLRIHLHLKLLDAHNNLETTVKRRTLDLEKSNNCLVESNKQLLDLQGYLVQSEKMSSLGTLVSGVGHEINNPINFVNAAAHNLKSDLNSLNDYLLELASEEDDEDVIKDLKKRFKDIHSALLSIDEGVLRVNGVVDNLRTFSRSGDKKQSLQSLTAGINSTLNLVKTQYKSSVEFKTDITSDSLVNCNASEINQVVMNLLVNACQVMQENRHNKKPLLILKTYDHSNTLVVEVSDNGRGIERELIGKIFDPFFTTKPDGKGTGLGLSISHEIIRRHKGELTVDSILDSGTTFKISLPLAEHKS